MQFDVRYPIGLLFVLIGAMVGFEGLRVGSPGPGLKGVASFLENVDLVWGAVMGLFGAVMLLLAKLASCRPPPP